MLEESSYACSRCRSSKRRCDRQRPQCSLCSKKSLDCSYPSQQLETTVGQETSEQDSTGLQRSTAFSALATSFLDFDFFKASHLLTQQVPHLLNTDGERHLQSGPGVHDIAAAFFETVHPWLPIFSRRLFYQHLLNPFAGGRTTDFYLVLLSMKLISIEFPLSDSNLYPTLKKSIVDAVDRGHLTLYSLQASILLAIFEIGHAIYPSAYFSVGFCTRLATALGVERTIYASEGPWTDIEEVRRCWWSILIMDRLIALGSYGRGTITPSPELSSILPCDDQCWDEEWGPSMQFRTPFQLGVASTLQLGRFGRLAQATRLLDQTIHLVASASTIDASPREQAGQLRRTIMALCHLYKIEQDERRLEYCSQTAVCLSAVFLLSKRGHHEPGTTAEDFPETQEASASIQDMLSRVMASEAGSLSLFLPQAIYRCASSQIRYDSLPPTIQHPDLFEELKATLQHLSKRWHCAAAYLEMLHALEATVPP